MFDNRQDAGKRLAQILPAIAKDTVVVAILRGGVIVAKEIALFHAMPLNVIVIRKIGSPESSEYAVGAVGPKGIVHIDQTACQQLQIEESTLKLLIKKAQQEQKTREKLLRGKTKPQKLTGKTVILVDDGVATGETALTAILAIKKQQAAHIILAVPVISKEVYKQLTQYVDQIVTLTIPHTFKSVGRYYSVFDQVEDSDVLAALKRAV